MRQQVQGEEEFSDEAQSRDCVKRMYHRKSLVLLMKTKGEDIKESWCRWSYQAERHRSSKHRNRGGGLRGVYRKFLFLCN